MSKYRELNNLRAHSIPRPGTLQAAPILVNFFAYVCYAADQMDVEASLPGLSAEMKAKIQQTSKEYVGLGCISV